MANPLYDRLNTPMQSPLQNNPAFNRFGGFGNFMNMVSAYANNPQLGNPEFIVKNMLSSGQITQEQFNAAAQMANSIMGRKF